MNSPIAKTVTTTTSTTFIPLNFHKPDLQGRATPQVVRSTAFRFILGALLAGLLAGAFGFAASGSMVVFGSFFIVGATALSVSERERTVRNYRQSVRDDALFRRQGFCALYVHPFLNSNGIFVTGMQAQLLIEGETVISEEGKSLVIVGNRLSVSNSVESVSYDK